ncbi:LCP family protein [Streptomyces qinzhouensis]|uniref:LytR family transcriptional regulator n=1 Tax=Streptomyces qinzhouensis TaxID=2599401 RepID=A0A5B8J8C4_9ACTN|nr:LCP family protein [Streptomyces qinzhouensis]QDY76694.1 LytR family transcriptional regulator [Streptomyces qinzhouensis]
MNDQQNPYDPYPPQPQIIGYDAYGQPVYQQPQQPHEAQQPHEQQYDSSYQQSEQGYDQPYQQPYDPYAQQAPGPSGHQDYGYDPHQGQTPEPYPPYEQTTPGEQTPGQPYGYDRTYGQEGYGYDTGTLPTAVDSTQQWTVPPQQPAPGAEQPPADGPAEADPRAAALPGQRRSGEEPSEERDYRTEQFSFIAEPDEESEDVIDWLKFTESRSERREEAKRRGRNRVVALGVALGLVVVAGIGWIVAAAMSGEEKKSVSAGAQKRDVIVVHLHNTKKKGTSTALLVDNVTTGRGTTVLLPSALSVADDNGVGTTLGKSVEADGTAGTREAVGTLLGARISGTWRLDTPFLENLVELVGNIELTTDTEVPGAAKGAAPLVKKGENQTLNGRAAVAYATHLAAGEPESKQLQRFGQVVQGVLKKFPSDAESATVTVETLGQILDPSLSEKDLGASLAKLADHAKGGDYATALLPVQPDGKPTEQAINQVVKDVLGGSVGGSEQGAAVRIGVRNATGKPAATEAARVSLVNSGYTVVDGGRADTAGTSTVTYGDAKHQTEATEVAKTLGLPATAVKKGTPAANADIAVVLGGDYKTG